MGDPGSLNLHCAPEEIERHIKFLFSVARKLFFCQKKRGDIAAEADPEFWSGEEQF